MSTDDPRDRTGSAEGRAEYEFSAGGVVVRGDDVVVIVPTKRGAGGARVLGLPKGHPERGETTEQTAAREVREEAGVTGELIESLGVVEYTYERRGRPRAKRVEFFLIEYGAGDPADHDREVEEARWMPLAHAAVALTYPGEREIVARAIARRAAS
ncbi:MAG: NUDIX domain-containing protein [Conexibacteraceae bacterium]|nr:NUDIX domain-containing protein [Conexibacteraceae bacterium]